MSPRAASVPAEPESQSSVIAAAAAAQQEVRNERARVQMVESKRSTFDYTRLPEATESWVKARGMNYVWVSRDHRLQLKYRHLGFRALLFSDITGEGSLEAKRELLAMAVHPERSNDEVHLSDSILMVRSETEQKFWEVEEQAKARALLGQTTLVDQVADQANRIARNMGKKDAIQFEEGGATNLVDHVHGGRNQIMDDPRLNAAVAKALEEMD